MMTTGTTIMIVCAILYGLITLFFKEKKETSFSRKETFTRDDPFVCTDGTPGADGLLADDFDKVSSE
jgi:hypothetical protein